MQRRRPSARSARADLSGRTRRRRRARPRRRPRWPSCCADGGARARRRRRRPGKRELAERLGARWTDPAEALTAEVDVLAPCALGGVLDRRVGAARCAAGRSPAPPTTSSPTTRSPTALAERGILWAPDFVANAGGIINISRRARARRLRPDARRRRVRAVGDTLRQIFDDAEAGNATPLAAAMELGRRLAAASLSAAA